MVKYMTLVREGMITIHMDEVKAFQYLDQFKGLMDPKDIQQIVSMMEDLHISTNTQQHVPSSTDGGNAMMTNEYVVAGWNDVLIVNGYISIFPMMLNLLTSW